MSLLRLADGLARVDRCADDFCTEKPGTVVAPRRGAWIEIRKDAWFCRAAESHPCGVRGLKSWHL